MPALDLQLNDCKDMIAGSAIVVRLSRLLRLNSRPLLLQQIQFTCFEAASASASSSYPLHGMEKLAAHSLV